MPGVGKGVTRAVVTAPITVWVLTESEAQGQESHRFWPGPHRVRAVVATGLCLDDLAPPAAEIGPRFLPEVSVQGFPMSA